MPLRRLSKHRQVWLSLCSFPWGPGAHKVFVCILNILGWYEVWFLNSIAPLLPCCCGFCFALGCGVSFFGRFLFIQQLVAILVFLQEEMSTCLSPPPSYSISGKRDFILKSKDTGRRSEANDGGICVSLPGKVGAPPILREWGATPFLSFCY